MIQMEADKDQERLDGAGDVFNLAVAEGVFRVGGDAGGPDGKQGDAGSHEIHTGVDRLGQDGNGADQETHDQFQCHQDGVGNNGQPCHPDFTILHIHVLTVPFHFHFETVLSGPFQ